MNTHAPLFDSNRAIETLMLDKFRTEPFHNLRLMYGHGAAALVPGGTCSDKTLSFVDAARKAGHDVGLHSARIDGEEKHRLARLNVKGRSVFADVGNGWPALMLYPADQNVAFRCYGVGFRTEISGTSMSVFCERRGRETLQLVVDVCPISERKILDDIKHRDDPIHKYPFGSSIRFSQVVGDQFLFLRGDRLEIHSENSFKVVAGFPPEDVSRMILEHFGFNIAPAMS